MFLHGRPTRERVHKRKILAESTSSDSLYCFGDKTFLTTCKLSASLAGIPLRVHWKLRGEIIDEPLFVFRNIEVW